jgi:hypothetical protein
MYICSIFGGSAVFAAAKCEDCREPHHPQHSFFYREKILPCGAMRIIDRLDRPSIVIFVRVHDDNQNDLCTTKTGVMQVELGWSVRQTRFSL